MGSVVDPSAVRIVGWALGQEEPVSGVEIEADGRVIWRGSVGVNRPDLSTAFPDHDWAGKAGFSADADIRSAIGAEEQFELNVNATLTHGTRICLATIKLRRPC